MIRPIGLGLPFLRSLLLAACSTAQTFGMRWQAKLPLVMAAQVLVLSVGGTALLASNDNLPHTGAVEHRVLHFPRDVSLGFVRVALRDPAGQSRGTPVGNAKGVVKVDVPFGYLVELELSGKVFQNPALLDSIGNEPIECLRVGFLSMDESEVGTTDRILAHVPQMRNLELLNADRSDATDKGFSFIKNMPKLRVVSMFNSEARGECFKQLATCPNLTHLYIWHCPIESSNLKYLSTLKKLEVLNVSATNVNDEGFRLIANCRNLKQIRAFEDPIDDRGVAYFSSLKKLEFLDLKGTKVTIGGIRRLKGLPLNHLDAPNTVSTADDAEIAKLFPHILIFHSQPRKLSKDDLEMFAPLH